MLTRWFGPRTLRQSTRECPFQPQLESLEDRLSPSGLGIGDGGINLPLMNNTHANINNSFNGQNLFLQGLPQSTLQGLFSTLYTQAGSLNVTAASLLMADEAQMALDAVLTSQGIANLSSSINALQNAIAANPMEYTMVGQLLGNVTFDMVARGMGGSSLSVSTTI
jgi:hypothetical protein